MHWTFWSREDPFDYIHAALDQEHWQLTQERRDALIRRVQRRFGVHHATDAVSIAYSRTKRDALAFLQREFQVGSYLSLQEHRETLIILVQRRYGMGTDLSASTAQYFVALSLYEMSPSR